MALTKKNFISRTVKLLTEIQEKCAKLNAELDPDKQTVTIKDDNDQEQTINLFGGRVKRLILPPFQINDNNYICFGVLGDEFALFREDGSTIYIGDLDETEYKMYLAELIYKNFMRDTAIERLKSLSNSIDSMTEKDFVKIKTKIGSMENFSSKLEKIKAEIEEE